jgi:hypothetical protein
MSKKSKKTKSKTYTKTQIVKSQLDKTTAVKSANKIDWVLIWTFTASLGTIFALIFTFLSWRVSVNSFDRQLKKPEIALSLYKTFEDNPSDDLNSPLVCTERKNVADPFSLLKIPNKFRTGALSHLPIFGELPLKLTNSTDINAEKLTIWIKPRFNSQKIVDAYNKWKTNHYANSDWLVTDNEQISPLSGVKLSSLFMSLPVDEKIGVLDWKIFGSNILPRTGQLTMCWFDDSRKSNTLLNTVNSFFNTLEQEKNSCKKALSKKSEYCEFIAKSEFNDIFSANMKSVGTR